MHHLEFTIEPFIEGNPGPHVTAAVRACEELGVDVEFGPFGSSCRIAPDRSAAVVAAITDAAMAAGATHLTLQLTTDHEEPGR